jgi:hypothetical protein
MPQIEEMSQMEEISGVEQATVRLNPCSGHDAASVPDKVSVTD